MRKKMIVIRIILDFEINDIKKIVLKYANLPL